MPTEFWVQILLTTFSVVLTAIVGTSVKKIVDRNKRQDELTEKKLMDERNEMIAMRDGIKAILRDRIIQADIHFSNTKDLSAEQEENIQLMYEAYHALGGNGVVTNAYKHLMAIPLKRQ